MQKCKNDMDKLKIIIMQGCPASGKSTEAKKIYDSNPKKYVIVCRDSIRESRGNYWVPDQEEYISDIEEFEIRAALKRNLIPIIDAVNLNPKTLAKWEGIASEFNAEIEYKPIYVPYKTALERDGKRSHPVGEKTLKVFYLRYHEKEFREEMFTDHTYRIEQDQYLPAAVIVDLDGTVAMHQGRGPFEWNKIYTDKRDEEMYQILDRLSQSAHIIFLTGRNANEIAKKQTEEWLCENFPFYTELIMRDADDFRHSDIVKKELYEKYVKDKYNIIVVFEDSRKCVKMWRELGLLCCDVANNDF